MKKRRAARTKMRQKRIQIAKAVRPVASEGVACQNVVKMMKINRLCCSWYYWWTSKTELNILTRTSRVVIRRPLRLETSSRGRRKLDQETATKNPEQFFPRFSNLNILSKGCTCGYEVEQKIFLPLSLHLNSEPCGGDSLPGQLDQEVLLLNWPNLRPSGWEWWLVRRWWPAPLKWSGGCFLVCVRKIRRGWCHHWRQEMENLTSYS